LINGPLYSDVWTDARLRPRDRSIATLAALTVLYRPESCPPTFGAHATTA